jgi:ATP-dependent Lon protease
MVTECAESGLPIAVCHVTKTLHDAPDNQPVEKALNSNQATYKPVPVVSAGRCEIMKTLDDGRLFVNVHLSARYHLLEPIQSLPYMIYKAEPYDDVALTEEQKSDALLSKDKLLHRLKALTADRKEIQEVLAADPWQNKSITEFSFEIFNMVTTEADIMQEILELDSPNARLDMALDLLQHIPAQL